MQRAATTSAAGTPAQTARLPPSCCCRPSSASSMSPGCLSWYSHPHLLINPLSLPSSIWSLFWCLPCSCGGMGEA